MTRAEFIATLALLISAASLLVAIASFILSLVVARRDRSQLRVSVGRSTHPTSALLVRIANRGRRQVSIAAIDLLLEDQTKSRIELEHFRHELHNRVLAEGQIVELALPVDPWQRRKEAQESSCIAVQVTDTIGKTHRVPLSRDVAAWFNGRPLPPKPWWRFW